ncbi:MAG: hypothetical protein ACYCOU_05945, partial [Sulfobacillus sp.]
QKLFERMFQKLIWNLAMLTAVCREFLEANADFRAPWHGAAREILSALLRLGDCELDTLPSSLRALVCTEEPTADISLASFIDTGLTVYLHDPHYEFQPGKNYWRADGAFYQSLGQLVQSILSHLKVFGLCSGLNPEHFIRGMVLDGPRPAVRVLERLEFADFVRQSVETGNGLPLISVTSPNSFNTLRGRNLAWIWEIEEVHERTYDGDVVCKTITLFLNAMNSIYGDRLFKADLVCLLLRFVARNGTFMRDHPIFCNTVTSKSWEMFHQERLTQFLPLIKSILQKFPQAAASLVQRNVDVFKVPELADILDTGCSKST